MCHEGCRSYHRILADRPRPQTVTPLDQQTLREPLMLTPAAGGILLLQPYLFSHRADRDVPLRAP